jgi:uncharacterized protein with HEPN domain
MRSDNLYLDDIVEAANAIARFLTHTSQTEFEGNDLVRSAVLQKLAVIGEAAARISPETRDRHPDIPWAEIAGFRNIVVHAYFAVDWAISVERGDGRCA